MNRHIGRADTHIHTFHGKHGDSYLSPEHVAEIYRQMNLRMLDKRRRLARHVIAITDHDTLEGALRILEYVYRQSMSEQEIYPKIVTGEEVTSLEGHIIGLYLKQHVPDKMSASETIAAIKEQGGLAVAPHPFTLLVLPFVGFGGEGMHYKGVGRKIFTLPFDAVEVINAPYTQTVANYWTKFLLAGYSVWHGKKPFAVLGASDLHFPVGATAYTKFRGTSPEDLYRAISSRKTKARGRAYGIPTLITGYEQCLSMYPSLVERCAEKKLPGLKSWDEMVPSNILNAIQYISETRGHPRRYLHQHVAYAARISTMLLGL
ncbi:hypothetical protein HYV81_04260 [Candidatus Woesearchaeota archaeon]|nr:hypothetical protein [Candidatus Woesearchaeota archaeon]